MSEQPAGPLIAKEETPEKPSILKIIVPFAATALIFWWLLNGIDFEQLKTAIAKAHLGIAIAVMVCYCIVFSAVDVAAFGLSYRWYLTDRVTWKDAAIVRCGMYLLQVALSPIAEIIPPTYFWRKWRVRALHTIGSEVFVLFCDSFCNITLLAIGFALAGMALGAGWLYFILSQLLFLALVWSYWLTPLRDKILPKLRDAAIMHVFRRAPMKHYFVFYGIRLVLAAMNLVANWALLDALGVQISMTHLFVLVPVIMFSTFLPISAGGFGGPQGAAVLMLVTMWHLTSQEIAVAYSLLWSTFFAVGRATIGAAFSWPVWMLLQQKSDAAATGE